MPLRDLAFSPVAIILLLSLYGCATMDQNLDKGLKTGLAYLFPDSCEILFLAYLESTDTTSEFILPRHIKSAHQRLDSACRKTIKLVHCKFYDSDSLDLVFTRVYPDSELPNDSVRKGYRFLYRADTIYNSRILHIYPAFRSALYPDTLLKVE
jgi:hypothetical protein